MDPAITPRCQGAIEKDRGVASRGLGEGLHVVSGMIGAGRRTRLLLYDGVARWEESDL